RGPCGVGWTGLELALPGAFQRTNATVALTMLALVQEHFRCPVEAGRRGVASVQWPGRLAILGREPVVVACGAHKPGDIAALARALPALLGGRRVTLVFAVMADKAWRAMAEQLLPLVQQVIVTRVGRRGLDPTIVADAIGTRVDVETIDDPQMAIDVAVARTPPTGAVLVTGSLFLVGAAYAHSGLKNLFGPWQGWEGDGTEAPG